MEMSDHYDELAQSYHDLSEKWAAVKNKIDDYFLSDDYDPYEYMKELAELVA
jgi:hypothetical protein